MVGFWLGVFFGDRQSDWQSNSAKLFSCLHPWPTGRFHGLVANAGLRLIGSVMFSFHRGWLLVLVLSVFVPGTLVQAEGTTAGEASAGAGLVEGNLTPFVGTPVIELQRVFFDERFPNVVVTRRGTVLLTWGNRRVRARRSVDGGKTWESELVIADPGFQGGGTTVDEQSGDILAFVEDHHPPAPVTLYRSRDDGRSWKPESIKVLADDLGNVPSMHMNEHGITLRHGQHPGRLIRPSRHYGKRNDRSEWPSHYTNAVFSDDGGHTWQTSHPFPEKGTGEAAIVELSDGRLYYNSRVHWDERPNNTRRRAAWSDDGGQTWTHYRIVDVLPDGHQHRSYGCMGGLVRLPVAGKNILIFSNLDTLNPTRERVTVWASFDGGETWPVKRLVFDGPSAYSSLAAGRMGTPSEGWIYLHFESGAGSQVARFNLTWVAAGELTGDGAIPDDLR